MRLRHHLIFSIVRTGRHQQGTIGKRSTQALQRGAVDRGRRRVDLEIADGQGARRAERAETAGQPFILRQHQGKTTEQGLRHARQPPPPAKGAFGHAGVDQCQRDAARSALHDQVGPNLRFRKYRQIGFPMGKKTLDVARHVEGGILMNSARADALPRQLGGRHGSGREQKR